MARQTLEINDLDDTYISSLNPTSNFGTVDDLFVGWDAGKTNVERKSIITFPLDNFLSVNVHIILEAVLILTIKTAAASAEPCWISRLLPLDWSETEATWEVRAAFKDWGIVGASLSGTDWMPESRRSWNLPTSTGPFLISGLGAMCRAGFRRNGDVTFLLERQLKAGNTSTVDFHSSDAGNPSIKPKLLVVYVRKPLRFLRSQWPALRTARVPPGMA